MKNDYPPSYVCVDGTWVKYDDSKMEFVNIESDIYGRDVITFIYNGKEYSSIVMARCP